MISLTEVYQHLPTTEDCLRLLARSPLATGYSLLLLPTNHVSLATQVFALLLCAVPAILYTDGGYDILSFTFTPYKSGFG
jgi:hypothetical protein